MDDIAVLARKNAQQSDAELGAEAADAIWHDRPGIDNILDPRTKEFANAVLTGLADALASSPGALKRMMKSAAAAAEDLNVEPFQGLIEVIQNADDLGAREVRFAFRDGEQSRELLVVHNGQPVACQHVLGMALPFLTTKTNRVDQRGRFGIGLKTLRRIADGLAIHSAPYHFSGDQLTLGIVAPEPALTNFYDPSSDTMIVLRLKEDFDEEALEEWFGAWDDDGLIFLGAVSSFRWCELDGTTVDGRSLGFDEWTGVPLVRGDGPISELERREVISADKAWTVWRATMSVPSHLHPAHKIRSETTRISIAMPTENATGDLYIGFKTRVDVDLPFSLDAQFDPSTTREALIESPWNNWLIEGCGDVVAEIAAGQLIAAPKSAWRFVPLSDEHVGNEADRWLRASFSASFATARAWLGAHGAIEVDGIATPIAGVAYEYEVLTDLLEATDIEAMAEGSRALPIAPRDDGGRWRSVLDEIDVSATVGTSELLDGFEAGLFAMKPPEWWVKAARILVAVHPDEELYGRDFWLSEDGRNLACERDQDGAQPLILGGEVSAFAAHWNLTKRLHPAYGQGEDAKVVAEWLNDKAAFRTSVAPELELAAFAKRFAGQRLQIEDADIRELRDRFDLLSDREAEQLGRAVGQVLLVDGFVYKAGKTTKLPVCPSEAYLCKTLDSDAPNWPVAAGNIPGIQWVAARYDDVLKTGATRQFRKRSDGTISRGPRKFMMLLGVETSPRLRKTGAVRWGGPTRTRELRGAQAELVPFDYDCPDLERVLAVFPKLAKKDLRVRSPALFRAFARNWERSYADKKMVASQHEARVYTYTRSPVTARWLISLKETLWLAIGKGELVAPNAAVIKTLETQTLYAASAFAVDLDLSDFGTDIAATLGLITSVQVSDLVKLLKDMRDGDEPAEEAQVMQVYRNIAKNVPRVVAWNTRIGNLTAQDLRAAFEEGTGLIRVGATEWARPSELLRGKDVFHDRSRFVPGGPAYAALWIALDVREPDLDDCLAFLKKLAGEPYDAKVVACLIDVYRYIEPMLAHAERRHRERLRNLPLYCGDHWRQERPIFLVEEPELRSQLAKALPDREFWTPPCDLRDLQMFVALTAVSASAPLLTVRDNRENAEDRGDDKRQHFRQAVDHLSDELARNDADTKQRMSISWDRLRDIPLFVHSSPIAVHARDEALSAGNVSIELQALMSTDPLELHVWEEALSKREYGGRAIASLFPPNARRGIEAEWVVAWQEARETPAEAIRLASDEEHAEAMNDRAEKINAAPKKKISVSSPTGKGPTVKPRTLKTAVGPMMSATVVPGSPPKPPQPSTKSKLHDAPPPPPPPVNPVSRSAPTAYTDRDLEQRGWELLVQVLETSADEELVDFRARHGVGADGTIEWKTFVELKATARGPQSSIEMSNSEYERAKERGNDFILALVSGLEDGYRDEVRLIFDPANRATVRPLNGVKLVSLSEAPAVVVGFGDAEEPPS